MDRETDRTDTAAVEPGGRVDAPDMGASNLPSPSDVSPEASGPCSPAASRADDEDGANDNRKGGYGTG